MDIGNKIMDILDQGITASKEFAVKAESKTRDLGEQGVLLLEIKQLEARHRKLITRMGEETYRAFVERNEGSVGRDTPEIAVILAEFNDIREILEKKKTELKNRRS
jgi:hypothetical protein